MPNSLSVYSVEPKVFIMYLCRNLVSLISSVDNRGVVARWHIAKEVEESLKSECFSVMEEIVGIHRMKVRRLRLGDRIYVIA